jgi:lysyl-tRNA synthetase class I
MGRPKRKDYSNLLKQLQKEYADNHSEKTLEVEVDTEQPSVSTSNTNDVNIDYDLTSILGSVNDLKELVALCKYCEDQLEIEQQITQDLLHAIEFSENYKERYKFSTQLHYNRKRRRVYKDAIMVLKPIAEFVEKEDSMKCINKITNLLGECRKTQERSNDRVYTPRILTEIGAIHNGKV